MPRVVEYFRQSLKAALIRRINMVTFTNVGSARVPSLNFVGLRVRKIRRIYCVSCLSTTVSQLFEPQLQKIVIFTYRSPHFCFPWRRPCDYHPICSMDGKTIQCLPNSSQHVPIYSFRVVRCLSQCVSPKIAIFTTFLFPQGRPWGNHAKCCMDGKRI